MQTCTVFADHVKNKSGLPAVSQNFPLVSNVEIPNPKSPTSGISNTLSSFAETERRHYLESGFVTIVTNIVIES